jgi:hypothetical protein
MADEFIAKLRQQTLKATLVPGVPFASGGAVSSVFGRAGAVVAQSGDYTAAQVGALADPTTTRGDLLVRGSSAVARLPVGSTDGWVLTADAASPQAMKWAAAAGGGGSQTPWTSGIDAAGNWLVNAGRVGVGVASPQMPLHVFGGVGYPAGNGATDIIRFEDNYNVFLGMGGLSGLPFGWWIQVNTLGDDRFPLLLQPLGGNVGVGNNLNPAFQLDVGGDINITGWYRKNGVAVLMAGADEITALERAVQQLSDRVGRLEGAK